MNDLHVDVRLQRGSFDRHVQLALPGQQLSVLFGASGTGKTSLLRAIAGLDRHPNALITAGGEVWQSPQHFVPTHRRSLGYVFQEDNLFPHLTVAGNLALAQRHAAIAADTLQAVIDQLQLGPLLSRHPWQLSGGERQKVAIARALALQPRLLLLDEPLSAVDEAFKQQLLPELKRLLQQSGITSVYVTHSSAEAAALADYLVFFSTDSPTIAAPSAELLTNLALPLAHRADAESVLQARVRLHDADFGLLALTCGEHELWVGGAALMPGQAVRLRVQAQDVSLTRTQPRDTSILNVLPVTIRALAMHDDHTCTVQLALGEQLLLARLTRRSVAMLDLRVGEQVYAQIKGVAVLR